METQSAACSQTDVIETRDCGTQVIQRPDQVDVTTMTGKCIPSQRWAYSLMYTRLYNVGSGDSLFADYHR